MKRGIEDPSPISDEEAAGMEYEKIRERLISHFSRKGSRTPIEMADETISRVAARLVSDKTIVQTEAEPARFFFNTAHYIFLEHVKKMKREQPLTSEIIDSHQARINPREAAARQREQLDWERRITCLDECKMQLPSGAWEMIIEYYQGETNEKIEIRKALAERLGLSPNALSIRAHRIRKQLEACLANCVKRIADGLP
jgi:DNA-directed RNA polymerase specialized sigma24 family protein